MSRTRRNRQRPGRTRHDLDRAAAELVTDMVWRDPMVEAEWQDVLHLYFPEWPEVVGEPDHIYVARRPRIGLDRVEGAACTNHPLIVVRASVIKKSRHQRRALLVHEAAHIVSGPDVPESLGLRHDLVYLLDHGREWQNRMFHAAVTAYSLPEGWVARQIIADLADAQALWQDHGHELEEIATGYSYIREFM
jgi:hypothetical protein